ncbi:MAG: ACT domain-containing protein [Candidatus Limnocylindrales bacterium]
MTREFLVHLDNRPGELSHLSRALAARGVDIRHVSCLGSGTVACACIIPDDDQAMRDVLHGIGSEFIEGDALVVDIEDRPGGLADITERFAAAGVNILGTMCVGQRPGFIQMAFTVDDEPAARRALMSPAPALAGVAH